MDGHEFLIKPSAIREIEHIPRQRGRRLIVGRIEALAADPRPPGCRKLSGREEYRIRQGSYRILYSVDDDARVVRIVKVGHRRDVSG